MTRLLVNSHYTSAKLSPQLTAVETRESDATLLNQLEKLSALLEVPDSRQAEREVEIAVYMKP